MIHRQRQKDIYQCVCVSMTVSRKTSGKILDSEGCSLIMIQMASPTGGDGIWDSITYLLSAVLTWIHFSFEIGDECARIRAQSHRTIQSVSNKPLMYTNRVCVRARQAPHTRLSIWPFRLLAQDFSLLTIINDCYTVPNKHLLSPHLYNRFIPLLIWIYEFPSVSSFPIESANVIIAHIRIGLCTHLHTSYAYFTF